MLTDAATLREALNIVRLPISVVDSVREGGRVVDFRIGYANKAASDLVKADPDELQGALVSEVVPGFTESDLFAAYVAILERGEYDVIGPYPFVGEVLGRHVSGTFLTEVTPFRNGFVSVTRDVTRAQQLEEALLEAQEIAGVGSWEWDLTTNEVRWSPQTYRIFGLDEEAFGADYESYLNALHPDDRDRADADIKKAYAEKGSFDHVVRVVRGDGEVIVLHARGRIVTTPDGEPLRMVGTGHDVTLIRSQEEALAQVEAELAHRREDQRRAAEINDEIIDSLVRASRALEKQQIGVARAAMDETLKHASRIVMELTEGLPRVQRNRRDKN